MMSLVLVQRVFRLWVSLFMLTGLTACDDAPETPTPKPSEIKKEMMRKRLLEKAQKPTSLVVQSFEIRKNGQAVALRAAHKDKVISLGASLCDFDRLAGDADKDKISKALKAKTNKLVSALLEMGHTTGSIIIKKGQNDGNFKEEIRFSWKGTDQQTSCQSGTF